MPRPRWRVRAEPDHDAATGAAQNVVEMLSDVLNVRGGAEAGHRGAQTHQGDAGCVRQRAESVDEHEHEPDRYARQRGGGGVE